MMEGGGGGGGEGGGIWKLSPERGREFRVFLKRLPKRISVIVNYI